MQKKFLLKLALLILLIGIVFPIAQVSSQGAPSEELSRIDALKLLRNINTLQAESMLKGHRYASFKDLAPRLQRLQSDLITNDESTSMLKNYKVFLVTAEDGKKYQISLVPSSDCGVAFFSSENGQIYEGKAIGCLNQ